MYSDGALNVDKWMWDTTSTVSCVKQRMLAMVDTECEDTLWARKNEQKLMRLNGIVSGNGRVAQA